MCQHFSAGKLHYVCIRREGYAPTWCTPIEQVGCDLLLFWDIRFQNKHNGCLFVNFHEIMWPLVHAHLHTTVVELQNYYEIMIWI